MTADSRSQAAASQLARRLAALADPLMRERVLLEYLKLTPQPDAVFVLHEFYQQGVAARLPFGLALQALHGVLTSGALGYEETRELYQAAKAGGLVALGELFLSSHGPGDDVEPAPRQACAATAVAEQTLGHRKWRAKSHDRRVLEGLLRAPEPEVLRNLLENRRITEQDVVLLAARRPTDGAIQRVVAASLRWFCRYPVKRALVQNPYTPRDLALRILPLLQRADVAQVQGKGSLDAVVREAARRLLAEHG